MVDLSHKRPPLITFYIDETTGGITKLGQFVSNMMTPFKSIPTYTDLFHINIFDQLRLAVDTFCSPLDALRKPPNPAPFALDEALPTSPPITKAAIMQLLMNNQQLDAVHVANLRSMIFAQIDLTNSLDDICFVIQCTRVSQIVDFVEPLDAKMRKKCVAFFIASDSGQTPPRQFQFFPIKLFHPLFMGTASSEFIGVGCAQCIQDWDAG